ncbi:MAG: hypothetical protein IPN16_25155 [Gemmatimonadetes bacterium]|nr:hypothetical protein [Gemmatimonadota bacterium]
MTLTTGDVWAGILAFADTGVQDSERDLILREPALRDGATGEYVASNYSAMHIPARLVQSGEQWPA